MPNMEFVKSLSSFLGRSLNPYFWLGVFTGYAEYRLVNCSAHGAETGTTTSFSSLRSLTAEPALMVKSQACGLRVLFKAIAVGINLIIQRNPKGGCDNA